MIRRKKNHIPGIRNNKDKRSLDPSEFGMLEEEKEMLCVLNIVGRGGG